MEQAQFEQLIREAIDVVPERLQQKMNNLAFVVEEFARPGRGRITRQHILLGLYEGVPLTRRGENYSGVLPDKITIFQQPIEELSGHDNEKIRAMVYDVVWHEIAHHFGFTERDVRQWEGKRRVTKK